MQIQNNYETSPNFGMSLKITPKGAKAVKNASLQTLEELRKIGKDLKDTKYYNLEIGKNLKPKITAGSKAVCVPPFYIVKHDDGILTVSALWDSSCGYSLTMLSDLPKLYLQFSNKAAATKVYNKLKTMNDRQQAAELVKLLEKQRNDMMPKMAAVKKEKGEAAKLAGNLINEFGVESKKNPFKELFLKLFDL